MKRLFDEERIKECIRKATTVNSLRNFLKAMLRETPDMSILESENEDEEMVIFIKKKEGE